MRQAALEEGLELAVASGFRDFARQVRLWSGKFTGARPLFDRAGRALSAAELNEFALIDAILAWSALPGSSRHHWGTEIDVFDRCALAQGARPQLTRAEYAEGGCFGRLSTWLSRNAARFGFFRPYGTDRGGVAPEPWHLSDAAISVGALAALTPAMVAEAIGGTNMPGRDSVLARLPELFRRYVEAVDRP